MQSSYRYFIINKPFNTLSQFESKAQDNLLGDVSFDFPEGIHAVGRLDKASEGLLILTTNKKVTRLLFQDKIPHQRKYLVKVKNNVSEESLVRLRNGISIRIKGGDHYTTTPCEISIVQKPAGLFENSESMNEYPPFTWLLITITEGKYHQIRKMVKAIHHRCQRLIRVAIEDIELGQLAPGEVRELEESSFFKLLKITNWRG
jgi:23S rRNA pseudouridine2457 synthase